MPYVRINHFWTEADIKAGRYVDKLYVLPGSGPAKRGYLTFAEAFQGGKYEQPDLTRFTGTVPQTDEFQPSP